MQQTFIMGFLKTAAPFTSAISKASKSGLRSSSQKPGNTLSIHIKPGKPRPMKQKSPRSLAGMFGPQIVR